MPVNYKEYHPKWRLISRLIRYTRAKNMCEWCGVKNGFITERVYDKPYRVRNVRIVLTVAHLDHDKTNNRFSNLAALCQRCHLGHDRKQHVFNRMYGRKTKYVCGKLF